jgi:hypothetical protein
VLAAVPGGRTAVRRVAVSARAWPARSWHARCRPRPQCQRIRTRCFSTCGSVAAWLGRVRILPVRTAGVPAILVVAGPVRCGQCRRRCVVVSAGVIGRGLLLFRTAGRRHIVRRRFCRSYGWRSLCGLLGRILWDWSERRRGNAGVRRLPIRSGKPELKLPEPGWQRARTAAVVVRRRRMPVWQAIKPGLQIGQRPRWRPRCQNAAVRPANAGLHCGWPGLSCRGEGAGTDGVSAHGCRGDVGGGGFRGGGFCGPANCCGRASRRAGDRQFRGHLSSRWWPADSCLAGRGGPGGRRLRWQCR